MIQDIYGNVLRFKPGDFYANRDRASLNSFARGAITLKMAKLRVCDNNGWDPGAVSDQEFMALVLGLGYGRECDYGE